MDRVKKVILFTCPLLAILILTGLGGCANNADTSAPVSTSESRSSGGFSFTVSVSNTHPRLGEKVIISTELQNVYNTAVALQNMGGETSIQITNEAGEVVWGIAIGRSGTTLTTSVTIGSQFGGAATWTATTDPLFTVPVTTGIYIISVSDTGFFDPGLNMQVSLSVTPIQIVVTG